MIRPFPQRSPEESISDTSSSRSPVEQKNIISWQNEIIADFFLSDSSLYNFYYKAFQVLKE